MNYLQTLDHLSYKTIISIAVFLAILFALPVTVFLVQQQTRLSSRAAYEKPKPATMPKATPGPIPDTPPQIGRVFPWVGKVGDIVWIQGKHFGTNPQEKKIVIGGVAVTEDNITAWEDTLIQAVIPEGAAGGGVVEVSVGTHPTSRSLPIVLYDSNTKLKLHKQGNLITLPSPVSGFRAAIWTGDDQIPTKEHVRELVPNQSGQVEVFDTQGLPVLSILLLDAKSQVAPYYVDPLEFDF